MPTINLSFVQGLWARLGERTKLVGIGVLAFILGTFWGGRHTVANETGRYTAVGPDGRVLLDTRTGEVWMFDNEGHTFKRQGAPTHSWF